MQVELDFVTPLWTADATGDAHHVEGTGLMGSLRWWYELLIRGLGGWACDPTDERLRCPHPRGTTVTPDNVETALCPVCQVFGATGWARAFSLRVDDRTGLAYPPTARVDARLKATSSRPEPVRASSGGRGYFFPPGRKGPVTLLLLSRQPADAETLEVVLGLLDFIQRTAALGAKTNLGYGLFQWASGEPPAGAPAPGRFARLLAERANAGRRDSVQAWPDLREMFFVQADLKSAWTPQQFASFKRDLRTAFCQGPVIEGMLPDEQARKMVRHFVLGTTDQDPAQGSKIKMALEPDRRVVRLWGWIPKHAPGLSRQTWQDGTAGQIVELVCDKMKPHVSSLRCWRFTAGQQPELYLESVMEGRP